MADLFDIDSDLSDDLSAFSQLSELTPDERADLSAAIDEAHAASPVRSLSDALLTRIFSYLRPCDLGGCARVSFRWRRIAELDALWRPVCAAAGLAERTTSASSWKDEYRRLLARAATRKGALTAPKTLADFDVQQSLGASPFGETLQCTDRSTRRVFGLRRIDKLAVQRAGAADGVAAERRLMRKLAGHPHVAQLFYTFQDATTLYFVVSLAAGGTLAARLASSGPLPVDQARRVCAHVGAALAFLHTRNVLYRDLKPENVLLTSAADDGTQDALLAHFFTAKEFAPGQLMRSESFVGTPQFMPPELLQQHFSTTSSDLWSFGCLIFCTLAGTPPFRGESQMDALHQIAALNFSYPPNVDPVGRDLVSKLLQSDPDRRLGANGRFHELQAHPFWSGVVWPPAPAPPRSASSGINRPAVGSRALSASAMGAANDAEAAFELEISAAIVAQAKQPLASGGSSVALHSSSMSALPSSSSSPSSPGPTSPGRKLVVEAKLALSPSEKLVRLEKQLGSTWAKAVGPNELILRSALVQTTKGLRKRRLQMLLTDAPRLLLLDPVKRDVVADLPVAGLSATLAGKERRKIELRSTAAAGAAMSSASLASVSSADSVTAGSTVTTIVLRDVQEPSSMKDWVEAIILLST